MSKCITSIESTITKNTECSVFTKSTTITMDELEHSFFLILDSDQSKGIKSELLSKLWHINSDLVKGELDQYTQLCRDSSDCIMSS